MQAFKIDWLIDYLVDQLINCLPYRALYLVTH